MTSQWPRSAAKTAQWSIFAGPEEDGLLDERGEWDEFELGPKRDDIWDAFERDDESAEPLPEYGDFWPEPSDEEI